jgi:hypothetical protein
MESEDFWQLIDKSLSASGGDPEEQLEKLEELLRDLDPGDIVEFDRLFAEFHNDAFTWSLWGAAYVIGGGCSDDGFTDFRGWLIARGQKVYEAALASPDSLADVVDEDEETQFEGFQYLPQQVWAEVTGEDEDDYPAPEIARRDEPIGQEWGEDELDALFPKLAKKFG